MTCVKQLRLPAMLAVVWLNAVGQPGVARAVCRYLVQVMIFGSGVTTVQSIGENLPRSGVHSCIPCLDSS